MNRALRATFCRGFSTSVGNAEVLERCALSRFVEKWRESGHFVAALDPLDLCRRERPGVEHRTREREQWVAQLEESRYGLDAFPADHLFDVTGILNLGNGTTKATLSQIKERLHSSYAGAIGVEFSHLPPEEQAWFAERLESNSTRPALTPAQRRNIYNVILKSETFDHFMQKKFPSFKRYGLEGLEGLMVALETTFTHASRTDIDEIVIGMPHRGRMNLLVGLLDLPARSIFSKVKGQSHIPKNLHGYDDVASHIAQSVTKKFDGERDLHVSLLHNPSHLEAVNPVSLGKTRAVQDRCLEKQRTPAEGLLGDTSGQRNNVMCLQMHGDAAFCGQGVVPESLLLSRLANYATDGTVHVVVNNQVGFTATSDKSRSSQYVSDMGKTIVSPAIHVNGESLEHVMMAAQLAVDYRNRFNKDVIIDLIGYRKWGHNELDEPGFTQPFMYKHIRGRESVVQQYEKTLKEEGILKDKSRQRMANKLDAYLEGELAACNAYVLPEGSQPFAGHWTDFQQAHDMHQSQDTGVSLDDLTRYGRASVAVPDEFEVHHRIRRMHINSRLKQIESGVVDWATAEAMCFGSLLENGMGVRLAGQDSERGTFSQRHGLLVDQESEAKHVPLNHISDTQAPIQLVSSPLSELAVLGFEYGYSWERPDVLPMWEAQFGDFFNGAQTIIDTFIASGESKWLRQSGIVMLLPHGYDGAGPDHSSSRIERFLQLCDSALVSPQQEDQTNLQVVNPTTPAQYFHVLRRQMLRDYRVPMVMVAPKTLLRLGQCVSNVEDMTPGTSFQPILGDEHALEQSDKVKTVVLMSGKLFYDINDLRLEKGRDDLAIIRLEELSPFPHDQLCEQLSQYPNASDVVMLQEEPQNAGFWSYCQPRVQAAMRQTEHLKDCELQYRGRDALPSPAVGIGWMHQEQQNKVKESVFTDF